MNKRRFTVCVTVLIIAVTGILSGAGKVNATDYSVSNPRIDSEGNVTWDCAYFGNYYSAAEYEKEPIKWRVLHIDENDNALVMADRNIDCNNYNETNRNITWEECTLRSWLNGYDASANMDNVDYTADNFIDTAFTEDEKEAIISASETDTEDKIYL